MNSDAMSLEAIRERLGIATVLFSFPFGSVRQGFAGRDLVDAARQMGIKCGLTATMDLVEQGSDPFR
jgi:hypothetical protein